MVDTWWEVIQLLLAHYLSFLRSEGFMVTERGTLVAKKIINLTKNNLTIYDYFGDLVTLFPDKLELYHGELPMIKSGTFVAVDESVDSELLKKLNESRIYKDRLIVPHPIGKLRNGRDGYRLIMTNCCNRSFVVTIDENLA